MQLNLNVTAIVNSMLQKVDYDGAMAGIENLQSQLEDWKNKAEEFEKTAKLAKEYKDNLVSKDYEIKRLKEQIVSLNGGESRVKNATKRFSVAPNFTDDELAASGVVTTASLLHSTSVKKQAANATEIIISEEDGQSTEDGAGSMVKKAKMKLSEKPGLFEGAAESTTTSGTMRLPPKSHTLNKSNNALDSPSVNSPSSVKETHDISYILKELKFDLKQFASSSANTTTSKEELIDHLQKYVDSTISDLRAQITLSKQGGGSQTLSSGFGGVSSTISKLKGALSPLSTSDPILIKNSSASNLSNGTSSLTGSSLVLSQDNISQSASKF